MVPNIAPNCDPLIPLKLTMPFLPRLRCDAAACDCFPNVDR